MTRHRAIAVLLFAIGHAGSAQADGATPGVVAGGSPDVTVNGRPAAQTGTTATGGGVIVGGSPNVFINGKPAALAGSGTDCGGVVVGGSANVLVNGKPLASAGSAATGCPGR
ncbi:PAAR domain-containing protein [Prosthecodimorpha staleyi]|uniref:PAAR domain-containing protein n=1 Tax=Prosthecodimorpha staleyi TaxID=2840188 RepID=A0A947GD44_9HYPH|nr:PAAR domain-containing protein [Prosthecodimorpha staleyi]MBT9287900.1 PAAR domain-containing protein [Prosthecodimorpha staleyi]